MSKLSGPQNATELSHSEQELLVKPLSHPPDSFTNASPLWVVNGTRGIAGSLILAHCTAAAYCTVPTGFEVHSVQAQFFAAGDRTLPVVYTIERVQSGKTFAARVGKVIQKDTHLASVTIGFMRRQKADFPALNHAAAPSMQMTPPDETIDDFKFLRTSNGPWTRGQRLSIIGDPLEPSSRVARHWLRTEGALSSRQAHHVALIYLSDCYLLDATPRVFDLHVGMAIPGDPIQNPQRRPDIEYMTTLNHNVHIHDAANFRADEWMYVEMDTPWAKDGRTMSRSRFFTEDGGLIATCIQEGFLKLRKGVRERISGATTKL